MDNLGLCRRSLAQPFFVRGAMGDGCAGYTNHRDLPRIWVPRIIRGIVGWAKQAVSPVGLRSLF